MQIEYRRAVDLTPYENNSRTHSKEQVGQIASQVSGVQMVINELNVQDHNAAQLKKAA